MPDEADEQRISVVLPVFNEDRNIARCLRSLWAALQDHPHEILVCYDFDEDTTLAAIAAMPDRPSSVVLVRNRLGRGAANALRAGFQAASGDVVVTTMADLSDPPDRIPELARMLRDEGATVVCGSRYMPGGSQTGGPFIKTLLSRGAGLSLRYVAGVATHDATNNFKAYRKSWLDRMRIESDHAFDIALELTVKAHLAGEPIREIPSSWTDRSEGESRFQVWKWLPKYLRWYWKAMRAPLFVWGLLLALVVVTGGFGQALSAERGAQWTGALAWGAAGAAFLALARRVRGRTSYADLPLPVLFLHPWHGELFHRGAFWLDAALTLFLGLAHVAAACGVARTMSALRSLLGRVRLSHVGLALLAFLIVARRLQVPNVEPEIGLDPSWRLAFPWFFEHGLRAGVDYVFTYGPLGYLEQGGYWPGQLWSRLLVWHFAARAAFALALVLILPRLSNPLEKALFGFAIVAVPQGHDSFLYSAAAAIVVLLLSRARPSVPLALLGLAPLALLSASKFTYLTLCAGGVVLIAFDLWRRRSLAAGALVLLGFFAEFALVWTLSKQNLLDLPAFARASLQIASGYSETMSLSVPSEQLVLAAVAAGATFLVAAITWAATRSPRVPLAAAAVAFAMFVAFKGGFVRQAGSVTFFGLAALAPFLILPPGPRVEADPPITRLPALLCTLLRITALVAALLSFPKPGGLPFSQASGPICQSATLVDSNLRDLGDLDGLARARENQLASMRAKAALPRLTARIGGETVDVLGAYQQYALLNDLNWKPRPIFQSYSAYTPWLLEKNAEHYRGAGAPRFVLWTHTGLGDYYMPLMDSGVLRVLLRDYAPRAAEDGVLLLERTRDTAESAPEPERALLLEREVSFGEKVDLSALEGEALLLALDIRYSLLGSAAKTLFKTPRIELLVENEDPSPPQSLRVSPGLGSSPFLVRPNLNTLGDWVAWFAGDKTRRIRSFAVRIGEHEEALFADTIGVRVWRADDLVPQPFAADANALRYSMFETPPTSVESKLGASRTRIEEQEALLVHAPSTIRYDVKPGAYEVAGRFALLPQAYERANTDGVVFRCFTREADGRVTKVFERFLDPKREPKDRGEQHFEAKAWCEGDAALVFETDVGYRGDGSCDWAAWWDLRVTPLQRP